MQAPCRLYKCQIQGTDWPLTRFCLGEHVCNTPASLDSWPDPVSGLLRKDLLYQIGQDRIRQTIDSPLSHYIGVVGVRLLVAHSAAKQLSVFPPLVEDCGQRQIYPKAAYRYSRSLTLPL